MPPDEANDLGTERRERRQRTGLTAHNGVTQSQDEANASSEAGNGQDFGFRGNFSRHPIL